MSLLGKASDVLALGNIRSTLVRLEDTIIFSLIERAQFAWNAKIYQAGHPEFKEVLDKEGFQGSWLDWFLFETEVFHAKARRYESPDEYPFTPREKLPLPKLAPLDYGSLLHPNSKQINVNNAIYRFYVDELVPAITRSHSREDDLNYGSAATRDLEVLQAISRRVHYGMFVSESKFRSCPADFVPHILNPNPEKLLALITKPEVEAALLVRLKKKAELYGSEVDANGDLVSLDKSKMKIDVDRVVSLYRDNLIPLTKDVEVQYLLHRLEGLSQEEIDTLSKTTHSLL